MIVHQILLCPVNSSWRLDTFLVRWVGGWVGGEMEIKANLSQRLVEVEAELGKRPQFAIFDPPGCQFKFAVTSDE